MTGKFNHRCLAGSHQVSDVWQGQSGLWWPTGAATGALKKFFKIHKEKNCDSDSFLIKLQVSVCNFSIKETPTRCFIVSFTKSLARPFSMEHLRVTASKPSTKLFLATKTYVKNEEVIKPITCFPWSRTTVSKSVK